jgi:hypothetical protein
MCWLYFFLEPSGEHQWPHKLRVRSRNIAVGVTKKCGKEVLKNKTSTMLNGGVICPTVRAGFDSLSQD